MSQASYEDFIFLLIVLVVTRFGSSCQTEATVDTLSSGQLVVLNTFSCESLNAAPSSPNGNTIWWFQVTSTFCQVTQLVQI